MNVFRPPLREIVPRRVWVVGFVATEYKMVTWVELPPVDESVIQSLLLVALRRQLAGDPVTVKKLLPPLAEKIEPWAKV